MLARIATFLPAWVDSHLIIAGPLAAAVLAAIVLVERRISA